MKKLAASFIGRSADNLIFIHKEEVLIAGEGLTGIILALGAVLHLNEKINLSALLDTGALGSGSFIILIMLFTFFCCPSGKNAKKA